MTLFYNFAKLA